MIETNIQDKTFDQKETLTKGEYEKCAFNSCNFADNDLSEFKFQTAMAVYSFHLVKLAQIFLIFVSN